MAVAVCSPKCAAAEEVDERICRYCFEGEDEGELVSPCRCSGGQKWVHLSCLRRWQRGVLSALPSYPGLIAENRQRVCNICNSAFTVPPPTHMELLILYTGNKVAELITEGSFIGSHKGFSGLLRRQLATLPAALRDGVGHRHWIRGLFLIVRVITSTVRTVRLKMDDNEDLQLFARRLEDNWAFEMHGRQLCLSREGPLADVDLPDDAEASRIRQAVLALQAPVTLTLRSPTQADDGEDGVIAVNLTRRITLQRRSDSYKRAAFAAAFRSMASEALMPSISHFVGGPCDEDEVSCCIVVGGSGEEPYTMHHTLLSGLCEAQARAAAALEAQATMTPRTGPSQPKEGSTPAPPPLPPAVKRRRAGDAGACAGDAACPGASESTASGRSEEEGGKTDEASEDSSEGWVPQVQLGASGPSKSGQRRPPERVRLLVFWGSAGWSRRQLLGETARGSWGLCRAAPDDVVDGAPDQVWEAVYPRLAFAPHSEISEDYVAQEEGVEDEEAVEENNAAEHLGWTHLRRFLTGRHQSQPPAGDDRRSDAPDSTSEDGIPAPISETEVF